MQVREFVAQLKHEIYHLPIDNINKLDLFIYYESQITLEIFRVFCEQYENSSVRISEDFLNQVKNTLATRWYRIARTRAAYNYYSLSKFDTGANILCNKVANLYVVAANSIIKYEKRSANEILMPPIKNLLAPQSAYENLVSSVIDDLNKNPNINAKLIQSTNIDMKLIANRILTIIDKLSKDLDESELFVDLESRQTLKQLRELLIHEGNLNNSITRHSLQPFIKLLKERWAGIDGTSGSYLIKPRKRTNIACLILANHLSLLGYRINYLNRDPERLMMPFPSRISDPKIAHENLKQFVYSHLHDGETLLSEMEELKRSDWKEYIEKLNIEKLISLLANGNLESFLHSKSVHPNNEKRSKAFLFSLFEIYKKERIKKPKHTTIAGALFQYVTKVYNVEDKLGAVEAVQEFLISNQSLASFNQALNNPDSDLFRHKGALQDSELQKFTAYIYSVIENLPQKIVENVVEIDSFKLTNGGLSSH